MGTVSQQLSKARETLSAVAGDMAGLEARVLAQHAWHMTPELIVRDADKPLDEYKIARLEELVARRIMREPIAQITGYKHFWNDDFAVTRDTLTPRADSEILIETALKLQPDREASFNILDLGTGSGCLMLTLLGEYPNARAVGVDRSAAALNVARRNAHNTLRATRSDFVCGSWCETLEISQRFAMVVSNPPYIPTREISRLMPDVRDHEPRLALDGGADGLDPYRAILAQLKTHLLDGAHVLFEVGEGQADDVAAHAKAQGYTHIANINDLQGIGRVVALQWNNPSEAL